MSDMPADHPREVAVSLFTTAKPFAGHPGIIQRNAMHSWSLLEPRPETAETYRHGYRRYREIYRSLAGRGAS